ncbi:serine hydrolase domain-containing protein [Zobellia alginiliquefaciens]|uniref:serine hydrolase domain-containing protein n=1 Tax=Zobellia alginiliquefaciens TaxID=3032586 RepID=UPI0023E0EC61|nr:serine hydrolase domain-containing protein [Zobellia alginiliquefaciens]
MHPIKKYLTNLFAKKRVLGDNPSLNGLVSADTLLANLVEEKKVPGLAITVLKKGSVFFQKGYGFANREEGTRVNPETSVFRIASVSKPIAATALAYMVNEKLIDLDAFFYTYVPYYPKKKYDFTIRQLASHTAGIRGYRGIEYGLNKPYSIKESIGIFKDDELLFEPGTDYLYNSFDWVLISLAMQEASGIAFEEYVEQKVLRPLRMDHTFWPVFNCAQSGLTDELGQTQMAFEEEKETSVREQSSSDGNTGASVQAQSSSDGNTGASVQAQSSSDGYSGASVRAQSSSDGYSGASVRAQSSSDGYSGASVRAQSRTSDVVKFYSKNKIGFREAIPVDNFYKLAGGGFLSTTKDIAKFGQAYLEGKVLNKELRKEFLSAQKVNGASVYYGLGWQVSEDAKGRPYFGHVGNGVGGYSNFFVYPEENMVFSILTNCTDPKIQSQLDTIIDLLISADSPMG